MYMNPEFADLGKTTRPVTCAASIHPSYVHDDDGKYMLSRGPLPSSIPGRYSNHTSGIDWRKTEERYRELTNELLEVNEELERKKKEMEMKMKDSVAYNLSLSPTYSYPCISTQAGASVSGSGFQWKHTNQRTSIKTDYEWPTPHFVEHHAVNRWGPLTKGCNLPQKNLLLRSEPFVLKKRAKETTKEA